MNFVFREQWLFLFCNKVSEEHLSPIFVTFPVENRTVTMISDHSNLSHARDASGVLIASSLKTQGLEVLKGSGSLIAAARPAGYLSQRICLARRGGHAGGRPHRRTDLSRRVEDEPDPRRRPRRREAAVAGGIGAREIAAGVARPISVVIARSTIAFSLLSGSEQRARVEPKLSLRARIWWRTSSPSAVPSGEPSVCASVQTRLQAAGTVTCHSPPIHSAVLSVRQDERMRSARATSLRAAPSA